MSCSDGRYSGFDLWVAGEALLCLVPIVEPRVLCGRPGSRPCPEVFEARGRPIMPIDTASGKSRGGKRQPEAGCTKAEVEESRLAQEHLRRKEVVFACPVS
jgi:hypothetical protein